MTHISANVAWQLAQGRRDHGTSVSFNSVDYACVTEIVSGRMVGLERLPAEAVGAFIASADPRVFRLVPADFVPVTEVLPPQEGDTLVWHGLKYRITRATYEDSGSDTHTLCCYAYREVV